MNDPVDPDLLRLLDEEHQDLRLSLSRLPRRSAPPKLMRALKRKYIGRPWLDEWRAWFSWPVLWKPVSAFAVGAFLAGLWISKWKSSEAEFVDMQPLAAAHSRYQAESLVPPGDMAGSNFGAQLA